jgi:serine/threonine protein kinase
LKWLVKTYDKKKYAKRESDHLNRLKNVPGVPRILTAGFSDVLNYIIISEAPGMDFFDYIKNKGVLSESEVKTVSKQLFETIKEMHKCDIIHKDIKPENIIYDGAKITLIDFEGKYTKDYQSPEQVDGECVTEKTDIWSTGVTLYYLMVGDVPFETEKEILCKRPVYLDKWSSDFKDFMDCLLERDIELRYNAEEALCHIWMTN